MDLVEFPSNRKYLRLQWRGARNRGARVSVQRNEIHEILKHYYLSSGKPVKKVLCHGVGRGAELDHFREFCPKAEVVGTDLHPHHPEALQRDFHEALPEWVGQYDIVYSNSLDHSHSPIECLQVWMDQVVSGGHLYVTWTIGHAHGRRLPTVGGDCFGAYLHEYIELCNSVGAVQSLLYFELPKSSKVKFKRYGVVIATC